MKDFTYGRDIEGMTRRLGVPKDYFDDSQNGLTFSKWGYVALGVGLSGGAYPLVLAGTFNALAFAALAWGSLGGAGSDFEIEQIVFAVGAACMAIVPAMLWAMFFVLLTMPVAYLFARTLQLEIDLFWHGAMFGGTVGFIAVLPIFGIMASEVGWDDVLEEFVLLIFGPGLTTVLGQTGGVWGARIAMRRLKSYEPAMSLPGPIEIGRLTESEFDGAAEVPSDGQRFRFGIRHLMWIAVWLSILLSLIRLTGIPFEFMLPVLIGWLIYQAATLRLGRGLIRRITRWRRGIQNRELANQGVPGG